MGRATELEEKMRLRWDLADSDHPARAALDEELEPDLQHETKKELNSLWI